LRELVGGSPEDSRAYQENRSAPNRSWAANCEMSVVEKGEAVMLRGMRTARTAVLVIALMVICLLAGWSPLAFSADSRLAAASGSQQKKFKVGWSIDTISTPFNAAEDQAVKEGWGKYPEVTLYSTEAQAQSIKQISDIEDLMAKGIDLLMVKPRDEKTLVDTFRSVMKKGVPVVLIDRYVEGEAYTIFVGSDNKEVGISAAKAMAKLLNGKGNVVFIEGTPGASSYIERTEGFAQELKKFPGMKILASQPCIAKRDEGKKLMENWLQGYGKQINGVHSNTDEITMGVIQALQEANRKDVAITSVNGQMELLKQILDGKAAWTAAYSAGVHPGIELSLLLLNGEKDVPKKIIIPAVGIGPEEAKKYYDPSIYLFDYTPGGSPALKEAEKQYPILRKLQRR
jgi:ABC-type sugar transport system substrate-binding protein